MGAIHDVQVSGDNQWGDFKSPESSLRAQELENQLGWEPTENAQKFCSTLHLDPNVCLEKSSLILAMTYVLLVISVKFKGRTS